MSKVKQNQWDLEQILPLNYTIPSLYLSNVPQEITKNFCQLLSRDVFSEGDAQFFYNYMMTRQSEFSREFQRFLNLWLEDELKHYEALRRVYHCIAGVSFADMDELSSRRIHEIEPIDMILENEFTILVAFMFDEIGSVYSYRRDLQEYYCHFGVEVKKIGHHLIRDEGTHFNNAAELLLNYHSYRLPEVKNFLARIAKLESSLDKYYKTFFLDHAQEKFRFPQCFNEVIIRLILARLGLGAKPTQNELIKLWQWTPQGYNYVPVS